MTLWKGKHIESYTRIQLEKEINNIYKLAETIKSGELWKQVYKYEHGGRSWEDFNSISSIAATNIEDYIRTRGLFPELEEIKTTYKRKYFTEK